MRSRRHSVTHAPVRLPFAGGLWLDDASRPDGAVRWSVNFRGGAVRPGSARLSNNFLGALLPNGLHEFAYNGVNYLIAITTSTSKADQLEVLATVRDGIRTVASGTVLSSLSIGDGEQRATAQAWPISWGDLDNFVVFAGPLEGAIGVIEFEDDGSVTIGTARGEDRSLPDNAFTAGDDAGPWDLCAPKAIAVTVHQGRVVAADEDGVVHISNLYDPHAWPTNRKMRVAGANKVDPVTALVPGTPQNLVIGQTNALWVYEGNLVDADTSSFGGTLRKVSSGVGIAGPAAWAIIGGGIVVFMPGQGQPQQWVAGQDIPMGGVASRIGGDGSLGPLFDRGIAAGLDLDDYRPIESQLFETLCCYSPRERTVTWAYPSKYDLRDDDETLTSHDQASERRVRVRYDFAAQRWGVEVHPPARALLAAHFGDGQELILRGDYVGLIFVEGVGDLDEQENGIGFPQQSRIPCELQIPVPFRGPERYKVRRLYLQMVRHWIDDFVVAVRREDLGRTVSRTVAAEADDIAFSTTGTTDGFTLGSTALRRTRTRFRRLGMPPLGVGNALYVEISRSTSQHAPRCALVALEADVIAGGRGVT